jgi:hypothetical protein
VVTHQARHIRNTRIVFNWRDNDIANVSNAVNVVKKDTIIIKLPQLSELERIFHYLEIEVLTRYAFRNKDNEYLSRVI